MGEKLLFELFYDDQQALSHVKHIGGVVGRPPAHVKIHSSWVLFDSCSHDQARFEVGDTEKHKLKGFFSEGEGPLRIFTVECLYNPPFKM